MQGPYAHSLPDRPRHEWQPLEAHLRNVAELAAGFAAPFGGSELARAAGLWHDLGKYSDAFQRMIGASECADAHIETRPGRVDHSTAGAVHAHARLGRGLGRIVAYAIAGHHAGLPDGKSGDGRSLTARLDPARRVPPHPAPDAIVAPGEAPMLPDFLRPKSIDRREGRDIAISVSFFIRMLYSCLVDADFLDTERFMDPRRHAERSGHPSIETLRVRLDAYLGKLAANAPATPINHRRAEILARCRAAASFPHGLFSLTVPTGGGKTLASLAFALDHALRHGLSRVIYVIPYTSIIEQNADVFRAAAGDDAVVEHHSNFDPDEHDETPRSRLAAENWDAPLVVTTSVQFFESLFANRSSRCRKLHNIANAVVILDEAQLLPADLLKPSLAALRELAMNYRSSVVLCTATQPAVGRSDEFPEGLPDVREIMPDPRSLHHAFRRVAAVRIPPLDRNSLAARVAEHDQALCIMNTRKDAREVFEQLALRGSAFHLSARMCPAHRSKRLAEIRARLAAGEACRVVSTQLVEAGVDVDFPVVFRAMAGLDSIAQAAGRCNREGRLSGSGRLFIFSFDDAPPPGFVRHACDSTAAALRRFDDPLAPEAVEEFFRDLYWKKGEALDAKAILRDLAESAHSGDFPFRSVADRFRLIPDGTYALIIPWNDEARGRIAALRAAPPCAGISRRLQRYAVALWPKELAALLAAGAVETIHERFHVLNNEDLYRDDLGLCPENPIFREAESLII